MLARVQEKEGETMQSYLLTFDVSWKLNECRLSNAANHFSFFQMPSV
jgi:hypothetical protein